jgi:arginine decarboxylase
LDSLNIGGGFPINSLAFEYDYQYMIDEIINQIKIACEAEVEVPHILLNLVLTVGESGKLFIKFCIKNNKMIEKNGI